MDPRDKIFLFILGSLISLIILSIFMIVTNGQMIDLNGMGLRT